MAVIMAAWTRGGAGLSPSSSSRHNNCCSCKHPALCISRAAAKGWCMAAEGVMKLQLKQFDFAWAKLQVDARVLFLGSTTGIDSGFSARQNLLMSSIFNICHFIFAAARARAASPDSCAPPGIRLERRGCIRTPPP